MVDIQLLEQADSEEFEELVKKSRAGMFYHSLKYMDLLNDFIEDARPLYLIAKHREKIVGALPSFIKQNSKLGNILNSLPFFGSIGGFLVDGELPKELQRKVGKILLDSFDDLAKANGCILSTVITSPFDKESEFYDEIVPDYKDTRISQIVTLPKKEGRFKENLLSLFESSGRRNLRKAQVSGMNVFSLTTGEGMRELFKLHVENISAKGGIVKPSSFFDKIFERFRPGEEFQIYLAQKDGTIIAALLLFYYDQVVEYYTPATKFEYRSLQAMPLVIYRAMADAIERGYRYWNFGGTWLSQKELYRFKRKWGAKDYPYYYIVRRHGDISQLLDISPEELGEEYKWFYALPFTELRDNK